MFARRCPSCQKAISFRYIWKHVKREHFDCPHCYCELTPKLSNVIVNSVILGIGTGAILAKFTTLSLEDIAIICALSGMFLQKYVDIFFSLEKYEE